jgi:ABC-type multidrug transport system fused ATPase/permease subunit
MQVADTIMKQAMCSEWKGIAASIGLAIAQSIPLYPVAFFVQSLFDEHLPNKDTKAVMYTILYMSALFISHALLAVLHKHVSIRIVKRQIAVLRMQAADSVIHRSRRDLSDKDRDILHAHIVQDSLRIDGFYTSLLNQFVPSLLITVILGLVAASIHVLLFAFTLAMAPILYVTNRWISARYRQSIRMLHQDFSLFSKHMSFLIKHDDLIHSCTAENFESRRSEQKIDQLKNSTVRSSFIAALQTLVQQQIILIGGALVLLAGAVAVVKGTTTTGSLISFYVAIGLLSSHARSAIGSIPHMIEGSESLKRMSVIIEDKKAPLYSGTQNIDVIKDITFEDVSFGYDENTLIIEHLSFHTTKGDTLYVRGPSGCGKTTITLLLMGFYKPTAGRILINGVPLEHIDSISMRRLIGVSMQDPWLFSATIRENLTYGLADIPDDDSIMRVCEIVGIDTKIKSLGETLDTFVGERGMMLSGGERQRLSIARALLRNPDVLILDEPENNLPQKDANLIIEHTANVDTIRFIISHDRTDPNRSEGKLLSFEISRNV